MACECPPVKTCGSRFLQTYDVSANQRLNVMTISSECGQGFLEFWSPYAFVVWTVRRQVDGVAETVTYRTGPASRSGVFLVGGGELTCTVYQTLVANQVDEFNGNVFATATVPQPQIFSRFVPRQPSRAHIHSQRFIETPYDRGLGLAGALSELAYPPHYSKTCIISSDAQISVIVGSFGVARQVRNVTQGVTLPFTVMPWERVDFLAGPANANVGLVWSETITALN